MIALQRAEPFMVRVVEAPVRETTVVDVLVGSFGLTGALVLIAVVAGLLLGAVLVWFQKRRGRGMETQAQTLELSPPFR